MNQEFQVTAIERSLENANVFGNNITIPKTESVLCFVNNPFMKDGDDFTSDPFYVINKYTGKKRKQLVNGFDYNTRSEKKFYVWKKIIEDSTYIPTLELRYMKIKKMYEKFLEEKYRPAVMELSKVGKAHCIPKHSPDKYWIYNYVSEPRSGFRFDWVDEKPEVVLNIDIGQYFYYITDDLANKWSERVWKVTSVFIRSLQNLFSKQFYKKNKNDIPLFVSFIINGRTYLVQGQPGKYMSMDLVRSHETMII